MFEEKLRIRNYYSEELDVLIQGNMHSKKLIIFVHGFGTNKHEGFGLFDDISKELLEDYLVVRYDCSGFGKSQGDTINFSIQKGAQDFNCILNYIRLNYQNFEYYVIAHSMGMYFSTMFLPLDIKQFIFTGIPNINSKLLKEKLISRIINSGGKYYESGISIYKRSSGEIQKFSKDFFNSFDNFNCVNNIKYLVNDGHCNNNVIMFRPLQDEIVTNEEFDLFKEILDRNFIELNGDHNFSNGNDRVMLIKHINNILL